MFRKSSFKSPIIMILLDLSETLSMEHERYNVFSKRIIRIWSYLGTAEENITGKITNFYQSFVAQGQCAY